jgi:single-strand DNA-binding protein
MGNDLNKWIGIGRLVRDSELKYSSGGTAVCKFSIAVGRRIKKNESWTDETSFVDIVCWGKTGEALNQYLVKGKQVAVEGELHQNRWEQEGQNRSKIEINANNIQLLGGGDKAQGSTAPQSRPSVRQSANDDSPPDIVDDIPGF